MECNVGRGERNVRLATGAAAVLLGLFAPWKQGVRIAALTIGVVELTTALTGYCPLNQLTGRNTCEGVSEADEETLQNVQEFAA